MHAETSAIKYIVASTLKPFISMSLYKNIHGFDVDATTCSIEAMFFCSLTDLFCSWGFPCSGE